ncbi:MAG TPA: Na(+)/H(+) antiporter subunit B [Pedomonas sp.]|uniref:Na(+)/H(+) antiporter subunit B n=1 Tax=Pedomonas sp. TaxID=2976421 RepID=UPI002F414C8D
MTRGAADILVSLLATALAAGLVWSAVHLPAAPGLAGLVERNLEASGVESAVTAVLLNFRAYDTLLEIGVLLLAVIGALSLHPGEELSPAATEALSSGPEPSPMLMWFVPYMVPVAFVIAGYLWWAGSTIPGGAFQGGTVLGAALVLLLLSGRKFSIRPEAVATRLWLSGGLLFFLAAGAVPMVTGDAVLQWSEEWSGITIVLIEAGLTLSIGGCLAALVVGVPAHPPERALRGRRP